MDNDTSDRLRYSLGGYEQGVEGLSIRPPPPALSIELRRHSASGSSRPRARSSPEGLTSVSPLRPPSPLIANLAGPSSASARSGVLSQAGPRSRSIGSQQSARAGVGRAPRIPSTSVRSRPSRDDVGETIPVRIDPPRPPQQRNLYTNICAFFGRGDPARKRIVSTYSRIIFTVAQIAIICVFVALTRTKWRSLRPEDHHKSEWEACDKPLGPMSIVWLVRLALGLGLIIWEFDRTRPRSEGDVEHRPSEGPQQRTAQPSIPGTSSIPSNGSQQRATLSNTQTDTRAQPRPRTESDKLWDRINNLTTLLIIVHFGMTNFYLLSSTHTCRKSSPHLWWLAFAILALTYMIIIEVLMVGFAVFILMPLVFITLNIALMCTGHRPISPRQMLDPSHISPDTPKMPQRLVDKIPLVLYIPAPEPANSHSSPRDENTRQQGDLSSHTAELEGDPQHTYPPVTVQSSAGEIEESIRPLPVTDAPLTSTVPLPLTRSTKARGSFAFLRRHRRGKRGASSTSASGALSDDSEPASTEDMWEDLWEKSRLPFIRLEGNRASCAICLMDFDEPPRKKKADESGAPASPPVSNDGQTANEESPSEPEPLRLLECGHCFHKSCLDPWLTGVSGRCPTCQRKVEISSKSRFRKP